MPASKFEQRAKQHDFSNFLGVSLARQFRLRRACIYLVGCCIVHGLYLHGTWTMLRSGLYCTCIGPGLYWDFKGIVPPSKFEKRAKNTDFSNFLGGSAGKQFPLQMACIYLVGCCTVPGLHLHGTWNMLRLGLDIAAYQVNASQLHGKLLASGAP